MKPAGSAYCSRCGWGDRPLCRSGMCVKCDNEVTLARRRWERDQLKHGGKGRKR